MLVVERIKRSVCVEFGVLKIEIEARGYARHVVVARMVAMALSRELTDLTLSQIGRRFGGRQHAAVLNATRRMAPFVSAAAEALPKKATPRQWARAVGTALELPE